MIKSLAPLLLWVLTLPALAIGAESGAVPDFSGLWMPARGDNRVKAFPRGNAPYSDWARKLVEEFTASYDPDRDEPAFFCIPPGMPGSMSFGAPFPLEIIQRPQDITMFFEGYFQYRKIYLDGYPRPEPVLTTRMGYSVGHWEGDTLVVTTTHLAERTTGTSILSGEASIQERIVLETDTEGKRKLVDRIVVNDPVAFTEAIEMTGIWEWSPETPILEYVCTEEIYQQHLQRVLEDRPE